MAAVWRVTNLVGDCLLHASSADPCRKPPALRCATPCTSAGVFAVFVTDSLRGRSEREGFERSSVRFIAEAVGLEGLRNAILRVRRPACVGAMAG